MNLKSLLSSLFFVLHVVQSIFGKFKSPNNINWENCNLVDSLNILHNCSRLLSVPLGLLYRDPMRIFSLCPVSTSQNKCFSNCVSLKRLTTPLRHLVSAQNDERMNWDFFLNMCTQELFNRIYVGKYAKNMFFMLTSTSLL